MDRGSFSRVESTHDQEKRLAFKAKLASKIESKPEAVEASSLTSFNGVAIGGILVHPSLGEGTLVEVKENEVIIDFGSKGLIGLVASQAMAFVHAPTKKEARVVDDPFLGGEIQRDLPARPDVAHRQVSFDKIVSPDFKDSEISFISEGASVWHPDFGLCTVHSVNEKSNNVILRVQNQDLELDLVLSSVRSKLREATEFAEHVPVKPLVRETVAKRVEPYKTSNSVSVVLPEAFKTWQRRDQFLFLSNNQKLTTAQANDVFSVLDGSSPITYAVKVEWDATIHVAQPVSQPESKPYLRETVFVPGTQVWHLDLGPATVAAVDSKNITLDFADKGLVELVLDITHPRLSLTEVVTLDHASNYRIPPKVTAAVAEEVSEEEPLVVVLPQAFKTWKPADQYIFLTRTRLLTPEQANDVIAIVGDKEPMSKNVLFEIRWDG